MEQTFTYYEQLAQNTWGSYLSRIEQDAIDEGLLTAGSPGVALELGCDGGRWSKRVTDFGWKIIATDVRREAIDVCQRRIPDARCICVEPSSHSLPVENEAVKLVLIIEVWQIMHEEWLISELSRVLVPGGVIIATCPNRCSWRGLYSRIKGDADFWYKDSFNHWVTRLGANGLEVLKAVGYAWSPFPRGSDSKLVPFAASLEKRLKLCHLTSLSPWVVVLARKAARCKSGPEDLTEDVNSA